MNPEISKKPLEKETDQSFEDIKSPDGAYLKDICLKNKDCVDASCNKFHPLWLDQYCINNL